jgi:serine/threonine-protein kinase
LAALAAANHAEVQRRAAAQKQASIAATAAEQRVERQKASRVTLARVATSLHEAITNAEPAAESTPTTKSRVWPGGGWSLQLGPATLTFSGAGERSFDWGEWEAPAFEVDAVASLSLTIPRDMAEYEGRSHSLWFGDIQEAGRFAWFETAFMVSAFLPRCGRQNPLGLDPSEQAAKAVWTGMAEFQVAWPFTRLEPDDLDDFVERWAGWFAAAATGQLAHPSAMPERPPQGTWRRS